MVNYHKTLVAAAAILLLATAAMADDDRWSLEPKDPGQAAPQKAAYMSRGRQVEVFRAESNLRSPEARNLGQEKQSILPNSELPSLARLEPTAGKAEIIQPSASSSIATCDDCGTACDQCGQSCDCCCCTPFWAHRNTVWGELLYLQPTGIDMAHAIQQNGVGGPGTVPAGRVGTVAPIFTPAFRVGASKALDMCSSVGVSYANFYSHATDTMWADEGVGSTLSSLVLHPNATNAGSTSSLINAALDVDFKLVDIDYRRVIWGGPYGAVNYTVGVRYGKLGQFFEQVGNFAPPIGTIQTNTSIKFEGVGLRTGLDGIRQLGCTGLSAYGKGFISVLFGDFKTSYTSLDTTTTIVQATSNWEDTRAVPILDYEVGINWTSRGGCLRLSSGYYTAFWFNSVTTGQYVQAVQASNFVHVGDTVAFEGFVSRVEVRF